MRVSSPTSTQRILARVGDLERDDRVAAGHVGQGRDPVTRPAEVRHDDDDPGGRAGRGDDRERAGGRRRAVAFLGRFGLERPDQAEHPATTAGRRHDLVARRAEGDDAEAIAAPGGEPPDHERRALGDVRLATVRRAEVHRRGVVEQEPGRQLALRNVLADVRRHRSGGGVPVDLADVVARLVRPDAVELHAVPATETAVIATHLATDLAVHGDLELVDEPVRDRAGPGSGRGARPAADPREVGVGGHAVGSIASSRRGVGTSVRTRLTMVSGVTPSASAE